MSHCPNCKKLMRGICRYCQPQEYIDMQGRAFTELVNDMKHQQAAQQEQWGASAVTHPDYVAKQKEKTIVLREMLEQTQKRPQNCGTGYCSCIECVMEPEATAWLVEFENGEQELHFEEQAVGETNTPLIDKSAAIRIAAALGWTPPRQWVGLTDVEWMNIVNKDNAWFGQRPEDVAHEVAKLVEAKLKQKNGYTKENT